MSPTRPSRRSRRRLPTICVDEHIPPVIVDVFRDHFRVIEARNDSRFKGRDERAFVMDLYAENAIFVTSDRVFAEEFARQRRQHGGAVLLPTSYSMDDRVLLAQIVVGLILGRCSRSAFGMRNQVALPRDDGLHVTLAGRDFLEYSWTHLGHVINDSPPHLNRRVRRKGRSRA